MTDTVQVISKTQVVEVSPTPQIVQVDPQTQTAVVVSSPGSPISVVSAGPVGPRGAPGLNGDLDTVALLEEVDTRIATHAQAISPIHENATSGRDFVALFQNGLI